MVGRFDLGFRRNRGRALNAARNLVLMGLLAGCSSVPDAVNPVEWYKGAANMVSGKESAEAPPKGDTADSGKTAAAAADTRKDVAKGLPADRGNAKYAEPVRREVTPTKQLARTKAPSAPAETQVAQAAGVPPKPAVAKQELPATQNAPASRQARDQGPDAPPAAIAMNPPAPADIPETVAPPQRGKVKPLQEQFQRRLAESAQQSVQPGMVDMPQPAALARAGFEEEPIHLVPPGSGRKKVKGGGKGMAAPEPELPAASFQIASVDFRSGSSELTAADRQAIAEVARVYKQTGGVVRVVGHAPAPVFGGDAVGQMMGGLDASMKRANAVARELNKRGVPGSKIMVGADPSAAADVGAQVFLDVV